MVFLFGVLTVLLLYALGFLYSKYLETTREHIVIGKLRLFTEYFWSGALFGSVSTLALISLLAFIIALIRL